ncbi:hypothetical protein PCANC_16930 [Puccinia coronata f. sp. avenae]|uniref:Uncharacterized protein n=1 Tax=Puccinia coronata f. sp. avenae TaxID=200324 RepID=A0A2N5V5M7_9BASI|nr:hypothetical protein PCANC_28265 [Puccinia coronata f. sp. avenae]PLW45288.1 hypothetical protein PCANC_16930 [Puccinia coronata f. sp. avenae]
MAWITKHFRTSIGTAIMLASRMAGMITVVIAVKRAGDSSAAARVGVAEKKKFTRRKTANNLVKLVTDLLAPKIATTFTALDLSSLALLPPEARRTFQEISSRFPPSTHATTETVTHVSDPEDVEAVEGFRWVNHLLLFVLSAAAKEHWTLEHAEGSCSARGGKRDQKVDLLAMMRGPNRDTERQEWEQVQKIMTLIANILFSVAGTLVAVFWLLHHL